MIIELLYFLFNFYIMMMTCEKVLDANNKLCDI